MFVSSMKPQPPRLLNGTVGYAASTFGPRTADEHRIAEVDDGPPASGLTASRKICTFDTATSSSAQPVTATLPLNPVAPCSGVSIVPNGGFDVPAMIDTRTVTVGELCAPFAAIVTVPVAEPLVGRPVCATATVKCPLPVPVPFVIWIHG